MSNKIQKLKPDTVLKNYWRNNERFADLFNAVLFDGEPVIRPEELEDADTEESTVIGSLKDYLSGISQFDFGFIKQPVSRIQDK